MTDVYLYALMSVVAVSCISLAGLFTLSLREETLRRWMFLLVSLATGALFGDALIHLIPEALEDIGGKVLGPLLIIGGILTFLALEKFLRWHHSHHAAESGDGQEIHPVGPLILVSDALHNFLDGIIIGMSYLISVEVGIATTIAIILHEIPQEIGDFALLLHAGFGRKRALFLNFLSALFAIAGTLIALVVGDTFEGLVSIATAFAAGGFLYIAGSDLVPEIHKTSHIGKSITQFFAIVCGVALMAVLLLLE